MLLYLAKRIGVSVLIILLAILTLFMMLNMVPGDPISIALGPRATPEVQAAYAAKMHLDKPVVIQFFIFLGNVVQGDLGTDVLSNRSVTTTLLEQLPFTITLAAASLSWAVLLGIPLGCLSAVRPNSWLDRVTGIFSIGTIAIPSFLVSIWANFSVCNSFRPASGNWRR